MRIKYVRNCFFDISVFNDGIITGDLLYDGNCILERIDYEFKSIPSDDKLLKIVFVQK